MDKWNISDIPEERRLEIDEILKKTKKAIDQNKIEAFSLEEFAERIKQMSTKEDDT